MGKKEKEKGNQGIFVSKFGGEIMMGQTKVFIRFFSISFEFLF